MYLSQNKYGRKTRDDGIARDRYLQSTTSLTWSLSKQNSNVKMWFGVKIDQIMTKKITKLVIIWSIFAKFWRQMASFWFLVCLSLHATTHTHTHTCISDTRASSLNGVRRVSAKLFATHFSFFFSYSTHKIFSHIGEVFKDSKVSCESRTFNLSYLARNTLQNTSVHFLSFFFFFEK